MREYNHRESLLNQVNTAFPQVTVPRWHLRLEEVILVNGLS